jgi:hypothetical protein
VVELAVLGPQAGHNIPKAFPVRHLGEGHAEILVETGEFLDLEVAAISIDALMKDMERQMLHDLRENKFARVHAPTLLAGIGENRGLVESFSSR